MNLVSLWLSLGERLVPVLLDLLNRSRAVFLLLLAAVLLRFLFYWGPKRVRCLMWALVALRLLLPLHLTSSLSVLGGAGIPVSGAGQVEYFHQAEDADAPGLEIYTPVDGSSLLLEPVEPQGGEPVSPLAPLAPLWLLGTLGMLGYALGSFLRLRRRLREAIRLEKRVWLSDRIDTPFILGLFRPRIYLPANLEETLREPALQHERTHLRRWDPWWKLLGWLILSVFWFSPFLWLCWFLFCRDLELSCDERVIRGSTEAERKRYASALLDCSGPRTKRLLSPLAFGETGVKGRIQAVMNYRKPGFLLTVLPLLLCAAAAVFLCTDPRGAKAAAPEWREPVLSAGLEEAVHRAILEQNDGRYLKGEYAAESHGVLALEETGPETTVWLQTEYIEFVWDGQQLALAGGGSDPVLLRFRNDDGVYVLTEYRFTREGEAFGEDFEAHFPFTVSAYYRIAETAGWPMKLIQGCYAQAVERFGIDGPALVGHLFTVLEAAPGEDVREKLRSAPQAYQNLLYLGDHTLRWVFSRFLEMENPGTKYSSSGDIAKNYRDPTPEEEREELRNLLLWRLVQDLAGGEAVGIEPGMYHQTAWLCWSSWLSKCQNTEYVYGLAWMEENAPYEALALKMSREEA